MRIDFEVVGYAVGVIVVLGVIVYFATQQKKEGMSDDFLFYETEVAKQVNVLDNLYEKQATEEVRASNGQPNSLADVKQAVFANQQILDSLKQKYYNAMTATPAPSWFATLRPRATTRVPQFATPGPQFATTRVPQFATPGPQFATTRVPQFATTRVPRATPGPQFKPTPMGF